MWAFGGKEVGTDGKVAINSKETIESVKFFTGFWKDACDEGGLAWDDSNNNRAFLSGTISATINGASIYIESLRNKEKYKTDTGALMHTDIQHAANPPGPAGAYAVHTAFNHGVMSYSKNQKLAKDFLKWWYSKPQMERLVHRAEGLRPGADQVVGVPPHVAAGPGHAARSGTPPASSGSSGTPDPRTRRRPRPTRSTSSSTCTRRPSRARRPRNR